MFTTFYYFINIVQHHIIIINNMFNFSYKIFNVQFFINKLNIFHIIIKLILNCTIKLNKTEHCSTPPQMLPMF